MRRALAAVAVLGVAAVVTLFEIGLRVFGEGRPYRRTHPGAHENGALNWTRVDPDLGWVFSGQNTETFLSNRWRTVPFDYRSNPQGFRDGRDFDAVDPAQPLTRIAVFGDSFVFGVYLNEVDTLPVLLEQRLGEGHAVYNLGIPGWGVDQMVLAHRKFHERLALTVAMLVYIDDDVLRVFEAYRRAEGINKPSFRVEAGRLVPRTDVGIGLIEWLSRELRLVNRLYGHHVWGYRHFESMRIVRALLAEFAAAARASGEIPVVVRYPGRHQVTRMRLDPRFGLGDVCERLGIAYIEPHARIHDLPRERKRGFFIEDNSHPARVGNEIVAELIAEDLRPLLRSGG
jgi:hypothetical protein